MAQTHSFQGTARTIVRVDDKQIYSYHRTAVVTRFDDGRIKLDSGGWKTATTRTAMNQAANQDHLGFQVRQKKLAWFVDWKGQTLPFVDGMVLA